MVDLRLTSSVLSLQAFSESTLALLITFVAKKPLWLIQSESHLFLPSHAARF